MTGTSTKKASNHKPAFPLLYKTYKKVLPGQTSLFGSKLVLALKHYFITKLWEHIFLNITTNLWRTKDKTYNFQLKLFLWNPQASVFSSLQTHQDSNALQSAPLHKTQYLHFRFYANYFLLPWKIPEEISRLSIPFHN